MSSEFDDIDAGLQQELQPAAPTGEPEAIGPTSPREPSAPEAPASQPEAPTGQPGPPLPANTAAPASAPGLVFCEHCRANVDPAGRGLCPVCGRFLPDNTVSLVTGLRSKKLAKIVDAYRVDLIEQLFAERGGKNALDVVSRIAIENYALVCAQHKTIEARLDADGLFTQTGRRRSAFDMLKGISETIDRLRAELPPLPASMMRDDAEMTEPEMVGSATRLLSMLFISRDELGQDQILRDLLHLFLRPWAAPRQEEMRRNIRQFCDEHERGLPAAPPNTRIDGDGLILLEPATLDTSTTLVLACRQRLNPLR